MMEFVSKTFSDLLTMFSESEAMSWRQTVVTMCKAASSPISNMLGAFGTKVRRTSTCTDEPSSPVVPLSTLHRCEYHIYLLNFLVKITMFRCRRRFFLNLWAEIEEIPSISNYTGCCWRRIAHGGGYGLAKSQRP